MPNVPIIIDGPNFISRMAELGIKNKFIASQLSAAGLRDYVNHFLSELPDPPGKSEVVEFVCSQKQMGPEKKKLSQDEQTVLLARLMNEVGVYVDQVNIPGSSEKGVDATVQVKMEEFAKKHPAIVLVSEDRDYVPVLHKLRHETRVITIAVRKDFPLELKNESYATIQVGNEYLWFFTYSYPRYDVNSFTVEQCADLYANADDRTFNRVSISHTGYVFMASGDMLAKDSLAKVAFESFCPYNGYVGPFAASDDKYMAEKHIDLVKAWKDGHTGILDWRP